MQRCQLFCHNQGIYLNEYMQEAMHYLFHDGGSCRIETSPLICSANQWTVFCIVGTYIMKDSRPLSSTYTESLFLHVVKHSLLFCFIFFFICLFIYLLIWLFFHEYPRISRTAGEGGDYLLISFVPLSPASKTLRH